MLVNRIGMMGSFHLLRGSKENTIVKAEVL